MEYAVQFLTQMNGYLSFLFNSACRNFNVNAANVRTRAHTHTHINRASLIAAATAGLVIYAVITLPFTHNY